MGTMLLSCCFRDPSKKKHKKRRSGKSLGQDGEELSPPSTEDVTTLLPTLPSPTKEEPQVFTVSSTKRVSPQERHPREIRKLRKQRSEENVKVPASVSSLEPEVELGIVPGLPSPPHTPPGTATRDHAIQPVQA